MQSMLDTQGAIMTTITDTDTQTSISDLSAIKRFILGGNAVFTIAGTDRRYTYQVRSSEDGSVYFLSLLTGSDNVTDYTYVGLIDTQIGRIRLTRKSRMSETSLPVVALNWILSRIWSGRAIAPAVFYHVGRCGRCGRALTVPSSIESGFGPECITKV